MIWKFGVILLLQATAAFAQQCKSGFSCKRPNGYCRRTAAHSTAHYSLVDCNGDGVLDPICSDLKANFGSVIKKGAGTSSDWPKGTCKGVCPRISGWCNPINSQFFYQDCDGDGIPDPVCSYKSGNLGVIKSSARCSQNWPRDVCKNKGASRPACKRANNFCSHAGIHFQFLDCDGDGIVDPICSDIQGRFGYLSSKSGCKQQWPAATCSPAPGKTVCKRPKGWCGGTAVFMYRDCDGDGIMDPVCSDDKGHFGAILSSKRCVSTWPNGQCGAQSTGGEGGACKIPAQESLGKDCLPEAQGGCINGNIGYPNLQAAWDKCAEVAECGFVMKYWNAKYYLRRANDPNAKKSNGIWGYKNNCPKSVQKEEVCVPAEQDADYAKNCGAAGCINSNIGYKSLGEAWAQCAKVAGCGFIMRYWNKMYYLRRATDPNMNVKGAWGYNYKQCCGSKVAYGKNCASGVCLDGNKGYPSLAEATAVCGKIPECSFIMRYSNKLFYLRRTNDPVTRLANVWGYEYKCQSTKSTKSPYDEVVRKWAPQVRLHPKEAFKPSGVDFFLEYVNLKSCSSPGELTPSNLPACNGNSYLETKQSLGGASGTNPVFLKGQDPKAAPVYAMVNEHSGDIMDITYWFFFPYNRGKRVCIGVFWNNHCPCGTVFGNCLCPRLNGCMGGYSTFGHHVADWEHVTVRLKNKNIQSMYLSIHDSEITNRYGGEFKYSGGVFRKGGKSLAMVDGTHAVVYSAEGSHGIWPDGGRHVYKNLPNGDSLVDYTGEGGIKWNTWTNVKIVKFQKNRQYDGEFQFLEFQGRWGNRKSSCGIAEKVSGECILVNGPQGPHRSFMNEGKLNK